MALSTLTGSAELVYRISFLGPGEPPHTPLPFPNPYFAHPEINTFDLAWTVAVSGMLGEHASPLAPTRSGRTEFRTALDGLRLNITRWGEPTAGVPTLVMCGLPWPATVRRLRLSAEFQCDHVFHRIWRREPADQWAAWVMARDGGPTVIGRATLAGATHEMRGGLRATIPFGTSAAASNVVRAPVTVSEVTQTVHDAQPYGFTLAASLDCLTGQGESDLTTNRGEHRESAWTHPFSPTASEPKTVSHVGFGLAIPSGAGTASVFVKRFSIETWAG